MRTLYISAFMLLLPFLLHAESFPYDNSPTIPAEEKSAVIPQIAVKTNGLLWLTTVMNGECEVFFRPHISASLSLAWCPWFISKKFALRNLSIMPEARWWLRTDAKGHFFGLHLSAAWYNVKFGDFRYQGTNHPLLGGGIHIGESNSLSVQATCRCATTNTIMLTTVPKLTPAKLPGSELTGQPYRYLTVSHTDIILLKYKTSPQRLKTSPQQLNPKTLS